MDDRAYWLALAAEKRLAASGMRYFGDESEAQALEAEAERYERMVRP